MPELWFPAVGQRVWLWGWPPAEVRVVEVDPTRLRVRIVTGGEWPWVPVGFISPYRPTALEVRGEEPATDLLAALDRQEAARDA
jgi:hypothetical protein